MNIWKCFIHLNDTIICFNQKKPSVIFFKFSFSTCSLSRVMIAEVFKPKSYLILWAFIAHIFFYLNQFLSLTFITLMF